MVGIKESVPLEQTVPTLFILCGLFKLSRTNLKEKQKELEYKGLTPEMMIIVKVD
ncbi:MAG TPA: hypothetical protein VNR38_15070 [Ureibacillus sp.]|nr:hypothetical protein [Ureibacillus sp.]